MRIRTTLLATLLLALPALVPAHAIDPAPAPASVPAAAGQDGYGEQVNVGEVLLDVLVTDRQGHTIVGLGPQDFVVEENGKPVELTGSTFYSNRRFLESEAASQAKNLDVSRVPEDRYFILFFHDQKYASVEVPRLVDQYRAAIRDARRWAADKLPSDYVAVVSYDSRLRVWSDFTTDPAQVVSALDALASGRDPEKSWPSRVDDATKTPLLANLPKGAELGKRTEKVYDAFVELAKASRSIVGRKNLVYFGLGFGEQQFASFTRPDIRYWPATLRALNDANVAVYTVDVLGATSQESPLRDVLSRVASETGGRYFRSFTNFATPLQQIAQETNGYYLLSYRAPEGAGDKSGYHEVTVRTKNPEFQVRTRTGYSRGAA